MRTSIDPSLTELIIAILGAIASYFTGKRQGKK
jgi:hypothetical protein